MTNPSDQYDTILDNTSVGNDDVATFADIFPGGSAEPLPEGTIILSAETVAAKSILTLTESLDNPGGFTIGLLLASHGQDDTGEVFRIPVVDIVLLAVVNMLKTVPDAFKAEIDKVNTAIVKLGEELTVAADDEAAKAAIATFNSSVGMAAYVRSEEG